MQIKPVMMNTTIMPNPAIVGRIGLSGIASLHKTFHDHTVDQSGGYHNTDPYLVNQCSPVPIIQVPKPISTPIDQQAVCKDDGVMRIPLVLSRAGASSPVPASSGGIQTAAFIRSRWRRAGPAATSGTAWLSPNNAGRFGQWIPQMSYTLIDFRFGQSADNSCSNIGIPNPDRAGRGTVAFGLTFFSDGTLVNASRRGSFDCWLFGISAISFSAMAIWPPGRATPDRIGRFVVRYRALRPLYRSANVRTRLGRP
jgi:hypothetical protein